MRIGKQLCRTHHNRSHLVTGDAFGGVQDRLKLIQTVVHRTSADQTAGKDITLVVFGGDDRGVVVNQQAAGLVFHINISAVAIDESQVAGDFEEVSVLCSIICSNIIDEHRESVVHGSHCTGVLADDGASGDMGIGIDGERSIVKDKVATIDGVVNVGTCGGTRQADHLLGIVGPRSWRENGCLNDRGLCLTTLVKGKSLLVHIRIAGKTKPVVGCIIAQMAEIFHGIGQIPSGIHQCRCPTTIITQFSDQIGVIGT